MVREKRNTRAMNDIEPIDEPRYKNIPVDMQTYKDLLRLCEARGFGKRAQGTMVRLLINKELKKLPSDDTDKLPT